MRKQTDTKQKLMETAIELIWQSSYSCVGVAEICKQAGVTKGGFYHYFETKADLFYEASNHHWECIKQDLDEMFSPSHSPLEQLENLISFLVSMQEEYAESNGNPVSGCPFFTSGGQAGTGDDKIRKASAEMSERATRYNAALVRSLKADGKLLGDPDPEQVGRMLFQYIQGLLIYGRVMHSLDCVKADLRAALYSLLNLKEEFHIIGPELSATKQKAA